MNVQPHELPPHEFYRILLSSIAPRPIAWVSTLSKDGIPNIAPFSFFNAICVNPPLLGFCPSIVSFRQACMTSVELLAIVSCHLNNGRRTADEHHNGSCPSQP
ncbi:MAG: flavin reductase family protein, partial [Candidatus Methylomirabilota bacterium]